MKKSRYVLTIVTLCCFVVLNAEDFDNTLKLAQQGDAVAQCKLGYIYRQGDGVEQDYSKSFYWYKQAAERGNDVGQRSLGLMYKLGWGCSQDDARAAIWFRKSAEQGDCVAQYLFARTCYCLNDGVQEDGEQAIYWYTKAAEQGLADAEYELGQLYFYGWGNNHDSTKDKTLANYWYQKAAEHGNKDAQFHMGMEYYMHIEGYTLRPKDNDSAAYWIRKSAEQGNVVAQDWLAGFYKRGVGVPKDTAQAMRWLKKVTMVYDFSPVYRSAKKEYEKLAQLGYNEAPDPLPPLLTTVDGSLSFSDGSNNQFIDARENSFINFKIKNIGRGAAEWCEARVKLTGAKDGLSIPMTDIPAIAVGQTYEVHVPIISDINTKDGEVTLSIEVYEPHGWGIAPFDLTVATKAYEAPLLQVVDYNVASNSGKIKKMEPFTLTFNLQNTKYGDAEDVNIKVNLPANVFVMDGSSELSFPLIKSGEAKSISLTLAANNNYHITSIPITIDVKEKYGKFAENKQLDIALNQTTSSIINIAAKEDSHQERQAIQLATLTADVDRNIPTTTIKNPNTFVLIIANEKYQSVDPVPFARNDGNIFRQYCEQTLGIPVKNIRYVSDATGNQLKAQINWLRNVVEVFDNPNIIFYYAGHGIPDESSKTAYLLPVDGIITDLSTCYKLDDLYATLGNMPAEHVTVFMDACFSGSKREQGMLASARGVAIKTKSGVPQGNTVVFSASQGDETAYPYKEKQHGMFTYYLLKKLQSTGGDVTLQELGNYILDNVRRQSLLENDKSQTPTITPSHAVSDVWKTWKLK